MSERLLLKNISAYVPDLQLGPSSNGISVWHRVPVSRRSLVLVLLFLGGAGELRVILTQRSLQLRNFPGHISLPGGKADTGLELEWQVARREMHEETGFPSDDTVLRDSHNIEMDHMLIMPSYLSRTFSVVRPCIGFMHPIGLNPIDIPLTLNPGETASIFSCPLRDFLHPSTLARDYPSLECVGRSLRATKWGGIPWFLRSYTFNQQNHRDAPWLNAVGNLSDDALDSDEDRTKIENLNLWGQRGSRRDSATNEKIYDVWGLTAQILHDVARVVYGGHEDGGPIGQEEFIYSLWEHSKLMHQKARSAEEIALIEDANGFDKVLPRTEFLRLKNLYKA